MSQVIHHADAHRSQILSILGSRGLEVPDIGVWDYAEATGLMQELRPGSRTVIGEEQYGAL